MQESFFLKQWRTVILVCGVALVYVWGLNNGFVWDDDHNITENWTKRGLHGLSATWFDPTSNQQYYPLTHTSWWIEYQLFGSDALLYHFNNALLHLFSALIVWRLLYLLGVPYPWFAAMLFAVHPIQVESVSWATERKNTLSTFFVLSSAMLFFKSLGIGNKAPPDKGKGGILHSNLYIASFALFALAILSKTVVVVAIPVLAFILWWKQERYPLPKDVLFLLPFLIVGVGGALATAWLEKYHVGATGDTFEWTTAKHILVAGRASWFYFFKMVFPIPIIFIYPRWSVDPSVWWQWLFPLGIVVLVAVLALGRKRWGNGPLVAALAYGALVFPALGFFNVFFMRYSFVQDHFSYLASVAAFGFIASVVHALVVKMNLKKSRWRYFCGAALLVTLVGLAAVETRKFYDEETLFRETIRENPNATMAHINLAIILTNQRNTKEAIEHYEKAVALEPDKILHFNLALLYQQIGNLDSAIANAEAALSFEPDGWLIPLLYAELLAENGDADGARDQMEELAFLHQNSLSLQRALLAKLSDESKVGLYDPELALQVAERWWRLLQSPNPMDYLLLAKTHAINGQVEQARTIVESFEQGTELPDNLAPRVRMEELSWESFTLSPEFSIELQKVRHLIERSRTLAS